MIRNAYLLSGWLIGLAGAAVILIAGPNLLLGVIELRRIGAGWIPENAGETTLLLLGGVASTLIGHMLCRYGRSN